MKNLRSSGVIPAKAGTHPRMATSLEKTNLYRACSHIKYCFSSLVTAIQGWVPAFAGMTTLFYPALFHAEPLTAQFTADHVSFNYHTSATIYSGHVQMQQGSTHIVADKVTVYKNHTGQINKAIATGKRAHYTTLPEQQKEPVDAWGDTIEYYPLQQTAILIGDGELRQRLNLLQGDRIVYNIAKQTVTSSSNLKGNKSVIVLQPQDPPGHHS